MAVSSGSTKPTPIVSGVEEWRTVDGYEGLYEVSSFGRFRSLDRVQSIPATNYRPAHSRVRRGQIVEPHVDCWGYPVLQLHRAGVRRKAKLHSVVCTAFHGPRPPLHDCAHGDGNKLNACASNLRWATSEENLADRIRHGSLAAGEKNGTAILSRDDVRAIRAEPKALLRELAARFGVSLSTISVIRNGKAWNTPGYF